MDSTQTLEQITQANQPFLEAKEEIGKVIVGQREMIDSLLLALLADGHILLEGLPGLAKTLAVTTLAGVIQCEYKRIQFTPDLLPADLIGTTIYNPKESSFAINKGPIFTNILLADEINRAPAKVQSALLEVMQERHVTISGQTLKVGNPFLVLATQNPIEHEGTYPLPEAQTDRFMLKILLDYPSKEEEKEIINRMATLGAKPKAHPMITGDAIVKARQIVEQIYIDDKVIDYILNLICATRDPKTYGVKIEGLLMYGASPRASIAMKIMGKAHAFLSGRNFVTPNDIKLIAHDILRHRLRRSYEAEAEGITADQIIDTLLNTIPVP